MDATYINTTVYIENPSSYQYYLGIFTLLWDITCIVTSEITLWEILKELLTPFPENVDSFMYCARQAAFCLMPSAKLREKGNKSRCYVLHLNFQVPLLIQHPLGHGMSRSVKTPPRIFITGFFFQIFIKSKKRNSSDLHHILMHTRWIIDIQTTSL